MQEFMDFEEKSVDRAVEKACSEFNIAKDQLQYDIISHGSSGIFGLVGSKKAVIRVAVPEYNRSTSPSEETTDAENASAVSALVDEAFGSAAPESEAVEGEAEAVADEIKDERPAISESAAFDPAPADSKTSTKSKPGIDPNRRSEIVDWVSGFISQLIELVSPESTFSVNDTEEGLRFDVNGGDSARLIGKRGQTLDAVQYLAEKAVYKQYGSEISIEIDVEGYLDKRRSELTSLASRLAQKAKQTGKPMVINRISAQDRRVVHLCLKDNRHVRTQSVGNGELRKLLILPKKKAQGKGSKPKAG